MSSLLAVKTGMIRVALLATLGLAGCRSSSDPGQAGAAPSGGKDRTNADPADAQPAARPGDGTGGGVGQNAGRRQRPPARVALRFADGSESVFGPGGFARLPSVTVLSEGQVARSGWSLRELASAANAARVVAVIGDDGSRVTITAAEWNDRDRLPLLRQNRRGMLKFQWIVRDEAVDAGTVRGVVRLELARE